MFTDVLAAVKSVRVEETLGYWKLSPPVVSLRITTITAFQLRSILPTSRTYASMGFGLTVKGQSKTLCK